MKIFSTQPPFTKGEVLNKRPFHSSFYTKVFPILDPDVQVVSVGKCKSDRHLVRNLFYLYHILTTPHDVLYAPLNGKDVFLIILLKLLHLYRKPIFVWKYTGGKEKGGWRGLLTRIYFNVIDRVYVFSKTHYDLYAANKNINTQHFRMINYSADTAFFQKYIETNPKVKNRVIASGMDNRDFMTLCKAVEGTNYPLLIITTCQNGERNYYELLTEYCKTHSNVQVIFWDTLEEHISVVDFVNNEIAQSSIVAVCCNEVDYGVGYTAVVEALPFGKPILLTGNKDIPVDVGAEGVGFTIKPYDVEGWREAIQKLMESPALRQKMGQKAKGLSETTFNGLKTAKYVLNDIKSFVKEKK